MAGVTPTTRHDRLRQVLFIFIDLHGNNDGEVDEINLKTVDSGGKEEKSHIWWASGFYNVVDGEDSFCSRLQFKCIISKSL